MSEENRFVGHGHTYVKVNRFQIFILRFKVKSWLTLCRPFIGNELAAEITQQNNVIILHEVNE